MTSISSHDCESIVRLLLVHPDGFAAKVSQYSQTQCSDPQMPFLILHSIIMDALDDPRTTKDMTSLASTGTPEVVRDILNNTALGNILQIDMETLVLSFCSSVPLAARIELSNNLASNTGGIE